MKKKKKILLIGIFSLIFFISAFNIIPYSLGYVFDFKKKKFIATGAFYFKTYPKECEISLNGKFIKKTDPIFGTALIKNLKPGKYEIEIEKEGYHPWRKELEIKEKFVTEAKFIFLFQENPSLYLLSKEVESFFPFLNKNEILLKKRNKNGWFLSLLDLSNLKEEIVFTEKDLGIKKEVNLKKIILGKKDKAILEIENKEKEEFFYLINISERPFKVLKKVNFPKEVKKISFHPFFEEKAIFQTKDSFFEYDLIENKIFPIFENILTFSSLKNNFLFLSKDGFIYKTNLKGEIEEIMNRKPFSFKKNREYELISDDLGSEIFIKECRDNKCNLYFLDQEEFLFKKLLENIKGISFSRKSEKVALFSDHEIWVFFLKDFIQQPLRKKGELIFLNRFSKKINQLFWLNENYIIFNLEDKVKISEIDDRDNLNIINFLSLENKKIFLKKDSKLILLTKTGNLFITQQSLIIKLK